MIILGIDPGYATLGYGIVKKKGNFFEPITYGVIITEAQLKTPERLKRIYDNLIDLINQYQPDVMAVEELFFNKNVKTAIQVGQARGVILLAGANAGIPLYEYTPLQVKQGVVGYGRANKMQVRQMVKALLKLSALPEKADSADALAVAICHGHSQKMIKRLGGY
ncbi:crossover junction endodeoxyribonuclease RuvC [Anoxybacter fermentans]|uniref:Crossover junction endodeoxyribonuclease RuvC n=1 Tax=Anoxybacter fermentans TaxID=1323375 RepID=A0A3Q9HRW1_9FIRM|nr:crossover junction endodeoxyribonuclease RuvC [Anoxybacter fermentans]AZR73112.1 crossover junction endodeoxyribonuclease RuvC [Anoxybacter fermentans]